LSSNRTIINMIMAEPKYRLNYLNPPGWLDCPKVFVPLPQPVEHSFLEQTLLKNRQIDKPYVAATGIYSGPEMIRECDAFSFVSEDVKKELREGELIFIMHMAIEGNHKEFPFLWSLHDSALRHDIPLNKIYYLTGDLNEKDIYEKETGGGINVYGMIVFAAEQARWAKTNSWQNKRMLDLEKLHQDKFFTALSRKARYWRSYIIKDILESEVSDNCVISHGTHLIELLDTDRYDRMIYNVPYEEDHEDNPVIQFWRERNYVHEPGTHYPADEPMVALEDLYNQVLFDVSLETWQDEGVYFYTEKTIKPMMLGMPVLIWGSSGMNKGLKKYGFKTYEDWFDLSFDDEPDTVKRKDMLVKEIIRVCNELKGMSKADRIRWSTKNKSVIKYNQKILHNQPTTSRAFTQMLEHIKSQ